MINGQPVVGLTGNQKVWSGTKWTDWTPQGKPATASLAGPIAVTASP